MKIKKGFIVRKVANEYVVVNTNKDVSFNGMLNLNESGAFIFGLLQNEISYDQLIQRLLKEYDVEKDELEKDINDFLKKLEERDLLEK